MAHRRTGLSRLRALFPPDAHSRDVPHLLSPPSHRFRHHHKTTRAPTGPGHTRNRTERAKPCRRPTATPTHLDLSEFTDVADPLSLEAPEIGRDARSLEVDYAREGFVHERANAGGRS